MAKRALISGITGQVGSLMADFLLDKDYEIFGIRRRNSGNSYGHANHLVGKIEFIDADLTDVASLLTAIEKAKPHEIYNMAAQSHVGISFKEPMHTANVTGLGVLNFLEAIRKSGLFTKFLQCGSSEMFGGIAGEVMLNETAHFHPRSPYGCSKAFAHFITQNYREAYNLFAVNSISFNHESPRRGENFVTRKITKAIGAIKRGEIEKIGLGNLDAKRDWSHAKDVVRGQWMALQHSDPDDFVFASGETHSVREFCEIAFKYAGLGDYQKYVYIDPAFYRPAEVDILLGDSAKAEAVLGWKPEFSFEDLVKEMVDYDVK